jgi:hypothetical protein
VKEREREREREEKIKRTFHEREREREREESRYQPVAQDTFHETRRQHVSGTDLKRDWR